MAVRHSITEAAKQFKLEESQVDSILINSRKVFAPLVYFKCLILSYQALIIERNARPKPHLDDKIITAWNALMISAFAKGYAVLGKQEYLQVQV